MLLLICPLEESGACVKLEGDVEALLPILLTKLEPLPFRLCSLRGSALLITQNY